MKKILSLIVFVTSIAGTGFAQTTNNVDVSRSTHAPIYDCSIYNFSEDRSDCMQVKRELNTAWDLQGYAVSCYESGLSRNKRELCLNLADRVTSNTHTIDCAPLYRDRMALRQCEITKEGYERGRFEAPLVIVPIAPKPTYTPVSDFVVNDSYRELCGPEAYDLNYQRWMAEKQRLEKRGRARAIGGAAAAIMGTLLSGSNNGGTRAVGSLLTVGGVVVMVAGAVDLSEANMSLPHMHPVCRQYYVPEVRMVTYEREVCRTTQYTERGWGYSRSYYEVQCNTRTYVSYERDFRPWHSGRPYRGY